MRTNANTNKYFEAVGRRKTSTARVRISESSRANFTVNGKDAKEYYIQGIKFIEAMPFDNSRVLECFGGIYGVVGATGRVVSSNEFLYNQNKRNIKEREFKKIFRIVNKLTKQKISLRPFLEHVIDKPTEEFEL